MNNSRGQIGESLTWVVATIVIIVILGISIFVVKFSLNEKEFNPFISNDLVATKSAVSFLSYENNFNDLENSIENGNYNSVKPKMEEFLEAISTDKLNWNFRVFLDGSVADDSVILYSYPDSDSKFAYFYFNLGGKKINLKFDEGKNE